MTISYQEEIKFISNKIRELRKEKQMTVQELAYRCDMERSNMSRIESGRTNLTVKTMCIICNALNVNLREKNIICEVSVLTSVRERADYRRL